MRRRRSEWTARYGAMRAALRSRPAASQAVAVHPARSLFDPESGELNLRMPQPVPSGTGRLYNLWIEGLPGIGRWSYIGNCSRPSKGPISTCKVYQAKTPPPAQLSPDAKYFQLQYSGPLHSVKLVLDITSQ